MKEGEEGAVSNLQTAGRRWEGVYEEYSAHTVESGGTREIMGEGPRVVGAPSCASLSPGPRVTQERVKCSCGGAWGGAWALHCPPAPSGLFSFLCRPHVER